jgi:hypothetical protein
MKKHRVRLILILLPAILVMAFAGRAQAAAILLHDPHVVLDELGLTAEVRAGLQAFSDDGLEITLDGVAVSLFRDGDPVDLANGPTTLNDLPFFDLPASLGDGDFLGNSLLFALIGLAPAASYTLLFDVQFTGDGLSDAVLGDLTFSTPAPVPEPGTLLLVATGCGLIYQHRRKRHRAM